MPANEATGPPAMPNYRRDYSGLCWFFTVITANRRPLFTTITARMALRDAVVECRCRFPFEIEAWVLLPDHLHCIWSLPPSDRNYSRRWSLIKRRVTQRMSGTVYMKGGALFWQARFWAHRIDDEADYKSHVDYIHYNPVKHALVQRVADWPWSTFHRHVRTGLSPANWGDSSALPKNIGKE